MSTEYQRQQALIGRCKKMSADDELAQLVVFDPRTDPRTDTNNFDLSKPTPVNPDNWQINPSSSTFTFVKPTSKPIPSELASQTRAVSMDDLTILDTHITVETHKLTQKLEFYRNKARRLETIARVQKISQ